MHWKEEQMKGSGASKYMNFRLKLKKTLEQSWEQDG